MKPVPMIVFALGAIGLSVVAFALNNWIVYPLIMSVVPTRPFDFVTPVLVFIIGFATIYALLILVLRDMTIGSSKKSGRTIKIRLPF